MKRERKKNTKLNPEIFTEIFLIGIVFVVYMIMARYIPQELSPDEDMRNDISYWIFHNNALPLGTEEELLYPGIGFSYGTLPYLPSLIAAMFMKLMSFVRNTDGAIFLASRMVSVLASCGSVFFCFRIGKYFFKSKVSTYFLAMLIGFLPQLVFVGSYLNNDAFSLFICFAILYFLLSGREEHWSVKKCIGLSISLAACILTYYFAYGWLLISVFFCVVSCIEDDTIKEKGKFLLKRILLVAVIVIALAGWFFVRNAVLHNGDFLGRRTVNEMQQNYYEEHHISNSPDQTIKFDSVGDMLTDSEWIEKTIDSTIGTFGNMNIFLPSSEYIAYYWIFTAGFILTILYLLYRRKDFLLYGSLIASILIPVGLSIYYSYSSDFQPQGRYIFAAIPALAVFSVLGYDRLFWKIRGRLRKYIVSPEQPEEIEESSKGYVVGINLMLLLIAGWTFLFNWSLFGTMVPELFPKEELTYHVAEDCSALDISYKPVTEKTMIYFVVWNQGPDIDGNWYPAECDQDGVWNYCVNLSEYNRSGLYTVHIYDRTPEEEMEFLDGFAVTVDKAVHQNYIYTVCDTKKEHCEIQMQPIETYEQVTFAIWKNAEKKPQLVEAIYDEEKDIWKANVKCSMIDQAQVLAYTGKNQEIYLGGM